MPGSSGGLCQPGGLLVGGSDATGQANRMVRSPSRRLAIQRATRSSRGRARAAPDWRLSELDRTEKHAFVASLASRSWRIRPWSWSRAPCGADRRRSHGSPPAHACGGCERSRSRRTGWHTLALDGTRVRRHQATDEGTDRARVVARPRSRWPRRPSTSPGPTRSSCVLGGCARHQDCSNAAGVKRAVRAAVARSSCAQAWWG